MYASALWWMTLRPEPYGPRTAGILRRVFALLADWPATAWVTFDMVEFSANIVMFVPVGCLVLAWGGRPWQGILIGVALSAAIEITQLLALPTRVADVRDLVANTVGAALGVLLIVSLRRAARASQRAHSRRHRKLIDTGAQ
ncbi:VanZ family protein [Microbacterium testaceum]|uniref:VanZ family protein n=1 Tax=Microbacterium testaceum TaxID=2033 RepID=UPI001D17624D|nr:VanZ family protein [Microbacterium testaceum]MCC4249590.1 VanZ family protein [Microbacterium testaceum]